MQWSGGGLGSSSLQLPVLSRKLWACVWERLELSCNLLNLSEWWKILSGEVDGVGSVKEFRQGFIAYASWLLLYKSRKRFIFDGVEDNVTEVAKTVEMFSLGEDDQISHADERLWASWAFKSVYSQPYEPKLVK